MSQYYEYNSGKHIDEIIDKTVCDKHNGTKGVACFYVFSNKKSDDPRPAVCDDRVKAAGFNGKIQPSSLRQKSRDGNFYSRFLK